MLAAGRDGVLKGLWFVGQKHFPNTAALASWTEISNRHNGYALFRKVDNWLKDYFCGKRSPVDFKVDPDGTAFQKSIWKKLEKIPWGKTTAYGDLSPESARAAGGAVGRNPISIIIPCHRVIGRDGSITGYAGGLERKKFLLELEGINISVGKS